MPAIPHKPIRLILDTDMGNDIDDALALLLAHRLQRSGEAELVAVVSSKPNALSPMFIDLVNTFCGRGDISIGVAREGVTPEDGFYLRQVTERRDRRGRPWYPCSEQSAEYPDAVTVLREQLAAAADRAIDLVMIGFSTNMARLLDTGPDEVSDLSGNELVRRKVRRVTMMAGHFSEHALANPTLDNREYNIYMDIASAVRWINHCPVPIVFTGLEVGKQVVYPGDRVLSDFAWADHHPVVDAYKLFKPMPYDRPLWDLTAVLFAVRSRHGYFGCSPAGRASVDEQGIVRFEPDPAGTHHYLTLNPVQRRALQKTLLRMTSEPHEISTGGAFAEPTRVIRRGALSRAADTQSSTRSV